MGHRPYSSITTKFVIPRKFEKREILRLRDIIE